MIKSVVIFLCPIILDDIICAKGVIHPPRGSSPLASHPLSSPVTENWAPTPPLFHPSPAVGPGRSVIHTICSPAVIFIDVDYRFRLHLVLVLQTPLLIQCVIVSLHTTFISHLLTPCNKVRTLAYWATCC